MFISCFPSKPYLISQPQVCLDLGNREGNKGIIACYCQQIHTQKRHFLDPHVIFKMLLKSIFIDCILTFTKFRQFIFDSSEKSKKYPRTQHVYPHTQKMTYKESKNRKRKCKPGLKKQQVQLPAELKFQCRRTTVIKQLENSHLKP